MSDDVRVLVIQKLTDVLVAGEDSRSTVSAAKALIDADKLNLQAEMREEEGVEEVVVRRLARRIDRADDGGSL